MRSDFSRGSPPEEWGGGEGVGTVGCITGSATAQMLTLMLWRVSERVAWPLQSARGACLKCQYPAPCHTCPVRTFGFRAPEWTLQTIPMLILVQRMNEP